MTDLVSAFLIMTAVGASVGAGIGAAMDGGAGRGELLGGLLGAGAGAGGAALGVGPTVGLFAGGATTPLPAPRLPPAVQVVPLRREPRQQSCADPTPGKSGEGMTKANPLVVHPRGLAQRARRGAPLR